MRPIHEIRDRLRQVVFQAREKAYKEKLGRIPSNCTHNDKGYCLKQKTQNPDGVWNMVLCFDVSDAKTCPFFEPEAQRGDVKAAVDKEMLVPEIRWRKHRDVAWLMWVLGSESAPEPTGWEAFRHQVTMTWLRVKNLLTNEYHRYLRDTQRQEDKWPHI